MENIYKIASKAEYIADVARDIGNGAEITPVEDGLLMDILRQLNNIAETLEDYKKWEEA